MRPDATQAVGDGSPLRRELADYLSVSGSHLSMAEAAGLAVRAWIAADRAANPPPALPAARGYRWKTVFLPHATILRMDHCGESHLAEVVGDAIVFRGARVSPRGMTLAVAGDGRNAWRDLHVMLPGARYWRRASLLRRDASPSSSSGHPAPPPASAPAALSAAALALADAFVTALALGESARPGPAPPCRIERRVNKHRRALDTFEDYCNFD
jgi:hypothetical protein